MTAVTDLMAMVIDLMWPVTDLTAAISHLMTVVTELMTAISHLMTAVTDLMAAITDLLTRTSMPMTPATGWLFEQVELLPALWPSWPDVELFSRQGDLSQSVSLALAGIQRARTCGGVTVKSVIKLSAR